MLVCNQPAKLAHTDRTNYQKALLSEQQNNCKFEIGLLDGREAYRKVDVNKRRKVGACGGLAGKTILKGHIILKVN